MFKLTAMLADAAHVVAGKLYILGGGWSRITAGGPFAVCGKIDIPWHLRGQKHTLQLELVDTDGAPFVLPTKPDGEPEPLAIPHPPFDPNAITAEINAAIKPGTPIDWPFAVNVAPGLPLQPGTRYEWRVLIDGHLEAGWTLPFSTYPANGELKAA